jgi:hypothetical protein
MYVPRAGILLMSVDQNRVIDYASFSSRVLSEYTTLQPNSVQEEANVD